jgi:uncharacterized protein (DUF362 family)
MVNKISTSNDLKKDIEKVLEPLGGIKSFVKPGERVFLKPNFNTNDPFPASSDMDFIKAVIEVIQKEKPKEIILGESPTYFGNAKKNFNGKNPWQLAKEFPNVKVLFLNDEEWIEKEIPKGKFVKKVSMPKILDVVDRIFYLPCLKTHAWAKFTGALKLTVGLVKPIERLKMHAGHLQEKIAEFNTVVNPDLVIMDGRKCFITDGPSDGKIAEPRIILASPNRAELDIEGVKIIQSFSGNDLQNIEPRNLPQIKHALELGLK